MLTKASTGALINAHRQLDASGRGDTARLLGQYWTKAEIKDELFARASAGQVEALTYAKEREWELPRMPFILHAEMAAVSASA